MVKKRSQLVALLTVLTVATTMFSACGNKIDSDARSDEKATSKTDEEFTIRVGVCSGDVNHYLKILDNHTDLFKENGINFEITEFAAGINTIDAIEIGQLDIGLFADYAGINRIGNTVGNTDLRAFTVIGIDSTCTLYVNPDRIKTTEDLYHANLISMAGVVFEYDYGKLFDTYGMDADKMTLQNVGSTQEALALAATGKGDAFWAGKQVQEKFAQYGWKPFVTVKDVGATRYNFLVANDSYLKEHHEKIVKFLKVSEKGLQYITNNADEVYKWISEDIGLEETLVKRTWEETTHEYTFKQDAYDDLKAVKNWCYENGKFDTDFEVGDFINTDALKELHPELVDYNAK